MSYKEQNKSKKLDKPKRESPEIKKGSPEIMTGEEKKEQVIYLLREGMYNSADYLIKQYEMNSTDVYMLAFPGVDKAITNTTAPKSGVNFRSGDSQPDDTFRSGDTSQPDDAFRSGDTSNPDNAFQAGNSSRTG